MFHSQLTPATNFKQLLCHDHPGAIAWINGNKNYPKLNGLVKFYHTTYGGVLVEAQIFNLPDVNLPGSSSFYAMHIHETGDCSDDFTDTGMHYNPKNTEHPNHAGDMPPLLSNQGYAYNVFYDKRFSIQEIIGRAVIIHEKPDDFTTQPSGNSGAKIGCGVIKWVE